jgi:hypothetical protein
LVLFYASRLRAAIAALPLRGESLGRMKERQIERGIEWEAAGEPLDFEGLELPCPPFVIGTRRFTLRRNAQLGLELEAAGNMPDAREYARLRNEADAVPAGTFLDDTEVDFEANGSRCWIKAWFEHVPGTLTVDGDGTRFVQRASHVKFRRQWSQKFSFSESPTRLVPLEPAAWRSDWFVNAPHTQFWRITKRRRAPTFTRDRSIGGVAANEIPNGPESRDHVVIPMGGYKFAISKVPEEVRARRLPTDEH